LEKDVFKLATPFVVVAVPSFVWPVENATICPSGMGRVELTVAVKVTV
jgi:hypothetical protein